MPRTGKAISTPRACDENQAYYDGGLEGAHKGGRRMEHGEYIVLRSTSTVEFFQFRIANPWPLNTRNELLSRQVDDVSGA